MAVARPSMVPGFGLTRWVEPADLLCDATGTAGLSAAETEIVSHMNEEHRDAVQAYARLLLGLEGPEWHMTGIDPEGIDLRAIRKRDLRRLRGSGISFVPQNPWGALNPILRIERQFRNVIRAHRSASKEECWQLAVEMLRGVGIQGPERVLKGYAHELSGGMQQRVMIAMALACDPALMIADEPTTSLDVTTQAQILKLIKDLRSRVNSAILYITHDLAVIAELCDRVAVMYAGKIVEDAPVDELFAHPLHPYAQGLLESIVSMDSLKVEVGAHLPTIPGTVPDLIDPPKGCRFHPRCKFAFDRCRSEDPRLLSRGTDHKVACHLYDEGGPHGPDAGRPGRGRRLHRAPRSPRHRPGDRRRHHLQRRTG